MIANRITGSPTREVFDCEYSKEKVQCEVLILQVACYVVASTNHARYSGTVYSSALIRFPHTVGGILLEVNRSRSETVLTQPWSDVSGVQNLEKMHIWYRQMIY